MATYEEIIAKARELASEGRTDDARRLGEIALRMRQQTPPTEGGTLQADIEAGLVPSGDTDTRSTAEVVGQPSGAGMDQMRSLSAPMLETAGQAWRGATGQGPSITGAALQDGINLGYGVNIPVSENVANIAGRVADLGLAGLSALGGVGAGVAGAAGDVAEAAGVPGAERLGRELAALPEAFAGSPQQLMRIGTAPRIPQQTPRQAANAARVSNAEAAIAAGAERGVNVMTSDALPPSTFAARWTQGIGEKIPIAGTGGKRAAQVQQRQDAITDVVRMYAPEGAVVDDILPLLSDDLVRSNSEFVQRYNGMKREVIDRLADAGEVDVTRTVGAIDQELARLRGMNNANVAPVIARLEDWKTSVQGQDLGGVEELRKLLGESFKASDMADVRGVGEQAINRIYQPLREDMTDFIRANGDRRDVDRWGVANRRLSENIQEVQGTALRSALNSADTKPETVKSLLFSQNRSDVSRLYRRLSPEGRQNARAAVLLRALENSQSAGELSPTRFGANMQRLARQTGVVFSGEDRAVVQGLATVLNATRRADQAAANPPTGAQNVPFIGGAVAADLLGGMGAAVTSAATIGGIARLYESPKARDLLLSISRARSGTPRQASLIQEYQDLIAAGAIAGTAAPQSNEEQPAQQSAQ